MKYRFLRFPEGKLKAFTMSYDDGCRGDLRLSDTLTKFGLKCTFNLNTKVNQSLSTEEIKEHFLSKGHEIAVHGAEHNAPGALRPIDGIRDVLECRLELEKQFGIIIRGMAYPDTGITCFSNNAQYAVIKKYLEDLDIAYSRTLGNDNNSFMLPEDWHAWMPSAHHNNPHLMEYIDEFLNIDAKKLYTAGRYPRLLYIWGHSFEFERENNWELLDEICEKISGKEDIWYATNIEIYNYVNAYNSLVFSADGTIVYNPTLVKLWFDIDHREYTINPGETLVIENK
ncbi:MAG: polysaccharide deacetylase family protein [Clostridiales bacterium]|nr:polysaccharide deacetylase family protein [Clostridiales bacterium]